MKKIALSFLFAAVICAGCSSTYDIRLSNDEVITAKGKPKLDKQRHLWIFVDSSGRTNGIPEGRVMQVAPQSMDHEASQFKPSSPVTTRY